MSITGHKSSTSLEIYQKVNAKETIEMGNTLGSVLTEGKKKPKRKMPTSTVSCNRENSENKAPPAKMPLVEIPDESDPNFDFNAEDILKIFE